MRQGEIGDHMFMLLSGEVSVRSKWPGAHTQNHDDEAKQRSRRKARGTQEKEKEYEQSRFCCAGNPRFTQKRWAKRMAGASADVYTVGRESA